MRAARLSSRRGLCAAPLACRRPFSRSIRPPARLLSSEPPKPPPPAFRNFAPRTKGSAAEKGADGVHARSEGGGGGGSSGGGGGGGNGGGGWPSASQLANFAATSAGLGLATFVIFGGRGEGGGGAQKEISMQHFMSNMLATGRVGCAARQPTPSLPGPRLPPPHCTGAGGSWWSTGPSCGYICTSRRSRRRRSPASSCSSHSRPSPLRCPTSPPSFTSRLARSTRLRSGREGGAE